MADLSREQLDLQGSMSALSPLKRSGSSLYAVEPVLPYLAAVLHTTSPPIIMDENSVAVTYLA